MIEDASASVPFHGWSLWTPALVQTFAVFALLSFGAVVLCELYRMPAPDGIESAEE